MGAQASKKCSAEEAELERRIAEKIAQARESPHLRCNQMGLVAIPSLLQNSSGEAEFAVQQELLAKLRSADFQGNSLQHFPPLELPQLRDLNLWGNNMSNEMFEGLATVGEGGGGRKRGAAQKFRTMLRAKGDSKTKRKRASSYLSSSPSSPSRTLHDSPVSEEEAAASGNGAALIGAFSHMPLLDSLDLSNNRLVYVPHTLAACTKLEQLSVEGNLLSDSEEALAVLSALVKLTMLNISLNRLTRIPGPVLNRGMLYTLLVRGNRILEVPAELGQLTCLQRLDLSDNCIDIVHADAFAGLDRMKTLLLCHNKLEHLAEKSFNSMGSLTHLMLHHNELTLLPLSVSALTSLRVLDASFNAIGSLLPASLLGLQCLTELNLSSNSLRELPSEMSALVQLRKLALCRNDLTALPLSLSALTDLMEVDLSWNQFSCGGYTVGASDEVGECPKEDEGHSEAEEGLSVLWRIPSLEVLSLASNELESLPENAFSALSSLRKLCLAANCLTNEGLPVLAPVFEGEHGAEEKSSDVPPSACALEWVGLTDNFLTSLPLSQLAPAKSSLLTLLLSSNPIETLSNGINEFRALEHFCVTMPTWEGDESIGPLDIGITGTEEDETATDEERCEEKHTERCEEKVEEATSPNGSGSDSDEEKVEQEEESGQNLDEEGEVASVAVIANGVESDKTNKADPPKRAEGGSLRTSAKAIHSPRGRLSLEPIVPAKECVVCDIVPAKSFFPPDMGFGKGLDHLQRLYVGNHCSEALIAGGGDLWFEPSFLPALRHSDVATLNSFPWRGSSCELPGGLSSGRPCGWAAMTGTAPHPIEDRVCLASIRPLPGAEADLVAVFDGHGGGEVALYVQEHLPGALEKILRQALADHAQPCTVDDLDIQSLISSAFEATNAGLHEFLKAEDKSSASVGCTAAVALFTRTSVYCANVGDSRIVLATLGFLDGGAALRASRGIAPSDSNADSSTSPSRSRAATADYEEEPKLKLSTHRASEASPDRGELEAIRFGTGAGSVGSTPPVLVATRLSVDHKPGLRPEVARVRASGTFVAPDTSGNTYRLTGGDGVALAVSRAFGDFYLAPGVVVEPYTCQRPITRLDRFLVLGSDGIWDVLTDQEAIHAAATVLRRHPSNPQLGCMLAASHLRDMAFALSSHDDLSVVVVSVSAPKL